jgi:hypothetical protein
LSPRATARTPLPLRSRNTCRHQSTSSRSVNIHSPGSRWRATPWAETSEAHGPTPGAHRHAPSIVAIATIDAILTPGASRLFPVSP